MKIAMCITCKGRLGHIKELLAKNIQDNPSPNSIFVLLDYGDTTGLADYVQNCFKENLTSGKLVYYRHEAVKFKMAHAKNMAHRAALREGADVMVNLDADNLTGNGFDWFLDEAFTRTAGDPQEIFFWSRMNWGEKQMPRGISGRIAVTRNAFLVTGGYDEKYTEYSPDDWDFNLRLRRLGFVAQEIPAWHLRGVWHGDEERFKEYPDAIHRVGKEEVDETAKSVNNGVIGCGTVFRNFDPAPIIFDPMLIRVFQKGMRQLAMFATTEKA